MTDQKQNEAMYEDEETRLFNEFITTAQEDPESYREMMRENGTGNLLKDINKLSDFSLKLAPMTMLNIFGDHLGYHMWEKFVVEANRDILRFIPMLSESYRVYFIYRVQTSDHTIHLRRIIRPQKR